MPRFDPQLGDEMAALLKEHRAHPEITFAQHLKSLEEEVANEALSKSRVYLDLKYWIYLREADLGKPQRPIHRKLLDTVLQGVLEGRFVCPITESVFSELDRQGDTERRIQTVRIIDRLCGGIVIKNSHDRLFWEIRDFFDSIIGQRTLPTIASRNVWVRPYSFLGTPQISGWGIADDLAINKAFLSCMWKRTLEDLLTDTPVPDSSRDAEFHETAVRITESSAKHAPQMRKFEKVFADEVGGLIQAHRQMICDAFQPYAAVMLRSGGHASIDPSLGGKYGLDLAYSVMSVVTPHRALPLIRILAGLHAFIRWQRSRPFQFGDFFDLRHAAAAIPYCNVFLTETFLKTACTGKLLDFGNVYNTRVISDEDEAIDVLCLLGS